MSTNLLRVGEAAAIMNLKPKTIWNKIYAREIEIIKIGRSVRIQPETIQALIQRGLVPAKESAA